MISFRTSKPISITENGTADDRNNRRAAFIEDRLLNTNRTIADGMNNQEYCYRSLLDNGELAKGCDVRFGYYAVKYSTQDPTLPNGRRKYAACRLTLMTNGIVTRHESSRCSQNN